MVTKKTSSATSTKKRTASTSSKSNINILHEIERGMQSAKKKVSKVKPAVVKKAKTYFNSPEVKAKRVNIEKFITDAIYMLLHPVKYFTSIKSDGNYEDTIVKVLMYGLLTAGIKILFNLSSITLVGTITSLILMPIYAILITFAFAGVMLFFSYLAKGEMNFETSLKAVASCIFMYPLSYVAYHIAISYWILFIFSLVIDLYILFLIFTATTYCLKGETAISRVIFGIFALFIIALHLSSNGAIYLTAKNQSVSLRHHIANIQNQNS